MIDQNSNQHRALAGLFSTLETWFSTISIFTGNFSCTTSALSMVQYTPVGQSGSLKGQFVGDVRMPWRIPLESWSFRNFTLLVHKAPSRDGQFAKPAMVKSFAKQIPPLGWPDLVRGHGLVALNHISSPSVQKSESLKPMLLITYARMPNDPNWPPDPSAERLCQPSDANFAILRNKLNLLSNNF